MSQSVTYDEWMSDTDALLWHIERDPLLRSPILSLWLLDRCPSQREAAEAFVRAAATVPRLRQRVIADAIGVAPPRWEEDPQFDIDYHVRRVRAPGAGTLRDVLDLAQPIVAQAFDRDRPVWEAHVVEGLADGCAALILKSHHAVADGVGGVKILESLVDRSRRPRKRPTPETRPPTSRRATPLEHLGSAVLHRAASDTERSLRMAMSMGRGWLNLATDPVSASRRIGKTTTSIGRVLRPASEPLSSLMRERSLSWGLDVLDFELEPLKAAGKSTGGTLNDAFVAAVAGALRLYHERSGTTVDELRMTMPVNLRAGETGRRAGNQFAALRFKVPVGIVEPRDRIEAVQERTRSQKGESALGWIGEITSTINRLGVVPATRIAGGMFKAVDFVTSNVPGLPATAYTAGARIDAIYPFAPPTGAALSVTLLSYCKSLHLGVQFNRAAVTDGALLRECLESGFAEVLALGG